MRRNYRKGSCPRCGYPKCDWYQAYEPCGRPQEQIDEWQLPPKACRHCGGWRSIGLGDGKGPHAAAFVCGSCGKWDSWVPKWRLALLLQK